MLTVVMLYDGDGSVCQSVCEASVTWENSAS